MVETQRPRFKGALGWWRKIAHAMGLHHETTARGLVRRFVSLDPGEACTEFRRAESERILRVQPYLADADVTTVRVDDSVQVNVTTIDEVPVVVSGSTHGTRLDMLDLGTMNLLGAGMHLEGRWENGLANRDGYGLKFMHPQLLGRPYMLQLDGMRYPIGEVYSAAMSHPFFTDLQRIAWHAGYRITKDLSDLRRPDRVDVVEPISRTLWDIGGVLRFGPPRRLGLIGAMIIGEHVLPSNQLFIRDSINDALSPTPNNIQQYEPYNARNLAAVAGIRALTFGRMRALDAVFADQDIAKGTQIGTLFGMNPFKGPLHHGFVSIDMYKGGSTKHTFTAVRADAESRVDLTKRQWSHLIASGRAAWYYKPSDPWTTEASLEWAGGWRTIIPFQLALGEPKSGVRGYNRAVEAGAQRVILRLEQRRFLTRVKQRGALGAAVFADAGRMWAGDAPYGTDTPVRPSVGVALLGAVPIQSQRTMRLELAVPLSRADGARSELRFVVREPAHGLWIDPPRIRWARLSEVSEQIFSWP